MTKSLPSTLPFAGANGEGSQHLMTARARNNAADTSSRSE